MMIVTYSEARQNLAKILDSVRDEGPVMIRRSDGTQYTLSVAVEPETTGEWPGIESGLTRDQILSVLRESRERG